MKKILFVVSQLSTGGAERVISILANNFASRGYEVHLITYLDIENVYSVSNKIYMEKCPVIQGNRIKQHLTRIKWIRKYIQKNNINTYITFEHYYGWTCAWNNSVDYITSMRNDPKHDRLSIIERILRKINFRKAKAVVFQTEEIKNYFSPLIQKHGYIIKNPLPNNIPYSDHSRENRIVAVSRLEPQKNISMMLKAFAKVCNEHPEYILEIYGDGSEKNNIQTLINELNLAEKVFLKGFRKNVEKEIMNAYMYVCTSNYEGLSNALLESMAMGLVVISTDSGGGGAREVIKEGINGMLVPVNDVDELTKKMNWAIENRTESSIMAQEGKKLRIILSENAVCDKWEQIL